jgi:hypothetical protein
MSLNAFNYKSRPPRNDELATTLGNAFVFWNELKKHIASRFTPLQTEWGFTSKKTGWGLRLKQEKRTILYMMPCQCYFFTYFALGEKAVKATHESDLSASVLKIIDNAKKYAEGRGVRIEGRSADDARKVEKLAIIKMAT